MKIKIKLILMFILLILLGCETILDVNEKPLIKEGEKEVVLKVLDKTGTLKASYNSNLVASAIVKIKSATSNKEISLQTNSEGIAIIKDFLSEKYLISISKSITTKEMFKATGKYRANIKLVNYNNRKIELTAQSPDTISIYADKLIEDSPIVFSEIYAAGPTAAGLYFHDKYVEFYNQSDSTVYLDGLVIARAYYIGYLGISWVDDSVNVHSKQVWYFPGNGKEYPIKPGEFVVCAEDAIDHRTNAPNSVDLSNANFEFYKADAPDVDNKAPNMKMFFQTSGIDWLIGGHSDALIIAKYPVDSIKFEDGHCLIPVESVLDGVEYLKDPTRLDKKHLYQGIDASATGGIEFYSGKSMERKIETYNGKRVKLKDSNNSLIDFNINNKPTPGYHNEKK